MHNRISVIFPHEELSYLKSKKATGIFQDYIDFYYEVYLQNPADRYTWHTSLPALSSLLSFNLDGPGWSFIDQQGSERSVIKPALLGHTENIRHNKHPKGMRNFFVALKPGLTSLLLRLHNQTLHNVTLDLKDIFKDDYLTDHLIACSDFHERIKSFEKYFARYISGLDHHYKYKMVQKGLSLFHRQQGWHPTFIDQICNDLAVSYHSFYRYFKEVTGYSPKFCQRITTFKLALGKYKQYGYNFNHWEYGFTDFSHFVKAAHQLTGLPPSKL